ncbi:MAG: hypothetical protein ACYDCL_15725 [Myxococcales bacterium]
MTLRWLPIAALLAACSKAPPPAPVADAGAPAAPADDLPSAAEREPNDSPQQAQLVTASVRINGDLHAVQPASHPDEDWYKVQPAAVPQQLRAELSGLPAGKLGLEVYDGDLNKLLALACEPGQGCLLPSYRVKGALYLRVFAPGGATGSYTLAVRLSAPDPDAEAEPNDRPLDATTLPLDHPLHGTIGSATDEDWYRVELEADGGMPADGGAAQPRDGGDAGPPADAGPLAVDAQPAALLQLHLDGVPGVRLQIHLFDQDQRPIGELSSKQPGDPIQVRDLALMPGVRALYLVVQSGLVHGKRAAAPQTAYTLAVHRDPAPPDFEIEPNDTLDQATPIAARRFGYLSPQGDVDFYLVRVAAPSLLHAKLSGLDHVDTELSVVDRPARARDRDRTLVRVNEGGPREPELIPLVTLPPGDHFVKVEAAAHQVGAHWLRDQENPLDPYELDVSLLPDDGSYEREPNDSPALATPIKLGQSLKGYAYPAKDVDDYRLDLSSQPIGVAALVKLQGVPKVPLSLQLRGPLPAGDPKAEGPLVNTSEHGKAGYPEEIRAKLDPGVYLISVRPAPTVKVAGQPGGDPDDAYTLSVQAE